MSAVNKPLQVNPLKLSAPMGATLAFLGVKDTMPLMHGAQGCASFTKVFFTRHFCEPIAIQTTAVTDITAILDGGDRSIIEAGENILKKATPKLIAILSTGLSETKGDDIKAASKGLKKVKEIESVYVHTPDYEGGLESGFAKAVESIIDQLVEPASNIEISTVTILPNVNITPLEVEKIKDFISDFGFIVKALPDLSQSLDGFLGEKQGAISSGGIDIKDIKKLASSEVVISIGQSMKRAAKKLVDKNRAIEHLHVDSLNGLDFSDKFVERLIRYKNIKPSTKIQRWRSRLCDLMLDSHFIIGKKSFALALEPDALVGLSKAISEVGGEIEIAISPTKSEALKEVVAKEVIVGDLEDLERACKNVDVIITNSHGYRIANRHKKIIVIRGYPNLEEVGNALSSDLLYEGSTYFLREIANVISKEEHSV